MWQTISLPLFDCIRWNSSSIIFVFLFFHFHLSRGGNKNDDDDHGVPSLHHTHTPPFNKLMETEKKNFNYFYYKCM